MKNKYFLIYPGVVIILFCLSALEDWSSWLIFPAVATLLFYLVEFKQQKQGNKILITGACLLVTFSVWQWLFKNEFEPLQVTIYSIIIIGAFEGWYYASYTSSKLWGLMNLVVFYIALEFLMLQWLPFDVSQWILGAPLLQHETINAWVLYAGYQGITLWIWLAGILLFKSFASGVNYYALAGCILIIILPIIYSPGISDNTTLYAQGEWIGRTCIWVSILIFIYSFVKRKTWEKE